MDIKAICVDKSNIFHVTEDTTLAEALELLNSHNFRCIPILDATGTIYRGNIYRQHILRHLVEEKSLDIPVTHLLKNATKYIFINSTFYKVFFSLRDLPYITILNEDHTFYGILTHRAFGRALHKMWNFEGSSYVVTVSVPKSKKGMMAKVSRIISRTSSITNVLTLDDYSDPNISHLSFTLEKNCSYQNLQKIITRLNNRGFEVTEVEEAEDIFKK